MYAIYLFKAQKLVMKIYIQQCIDINYLSLSGISNVSSYKVRKRVTMLNTIIKLGKTKITVFC